MGILIASIGTTVALVGGTAYFLRRRVSRDWINLESKHYDNVGGKVFVITGGNVGLGLKTATDLSRRGGTVVLACRDLVKGQAAAELIQQTTGNQHVVCLELDLASLASVRAFADTLKSKYPLIDALICNAGVWVPMDQHCKTPNGLFEIHFGVNHLGHFLLIQCLIQNFKQDGRIVLVSSGLLKQGQIDFDKQEFVREGRDVMESGSTTGNKKTSFAPTGYCDSKLMNALTCRYLASTILRDTGVTAYAVCPGFCRSSLGRHVSFPFHKKLLFAPIILLVQRTSVQGAQNIVFATLEGKDTLQNGGFYRDGNIAEGETQHVDVFGDDAPKKLWELSEKLVHDT